MKLPPSHFDSLERHVNNHEEQVVTLRASRQALLDEIRRRETASQGRGEDKSRLPSTKRGGIPVLISQRDVIEQELRTHEALIALGRDKRILNTLAELTGNLDLAREAARDPKAFATGRGIEIPANMALDLKVDRDRINLRVTYYDDLAPFVLTWSNDDGFSPPQLALPDATAPVAPPTGKQLNQRAEKRRQGPR